MEKIHATRSKDGHLLLRYRLVFDDWGMARHESRHESRHDTDVTSSKRYALRIYKRMDSDTGR